MADAPSHPREGARLQRVEAATAAFEEALARGRLHHAWLLTGPQGVGKASFAYHGARRLLGAPPAAPGRLEASAHDSVSRMVAARSHPDLLVLKRHVEGAPARRNIPVDEARRLPEFFSKAPAIAPYRVAIIDAADDLNVNAANAVLKTLEEPSGRGVVFLVSHAPGRLLTTIRSRCRRLAFAPWPAEALAAFAAERLALGTGDATRLAAMANGAPGRVLTLMESGALEVQATARRLLDGVADAEGRSLALRLVDSLRGVEGMATLALLLERLAEGLRLAALEAVEPEAAQAWAELWRRVTDLPGRVEGLNLDRADAFWTLLAELNAAVRRFGPAPC